MATDNVPDLSLQEQLAALQVRVDSETPSELRASLEQDLDTLIRSGTACRSSCSSCSKQGLMEEERLLLKAICSEKLTTSGSYAGEILLLHRKGEIMYPRMPFPKQGIDALPVMTGVGAALSWGLATVISKEALATTAPVPLLLLQLVVSTFALWIVVIIRRAPLPTGYAFIRTSLPGLLQPGLAYTLGIIGLALTMVSVETVLWATEPLFVLVLTWLLFKERVSSLLLVRLLLAFLGVVLVSITGPVDVGANWALLGNGLILLGSLSAALYTIVSQGMIHKRDPLIVTTLHHTGGLIWAAGAWLVVLLWRSAPALQVFPPRIWLLGALSGLGQYALPFWLYMLTLKRMPISRGSLFLLLIPVSSIGGAALFLGERLTILQWIGAGLILMMVISLVIPSPREEQEVQK